MALGISGFGASQTLASPQLFQALSLGGAKPVPPQPPYGTPNPNLVPVTLTTQPALPANLTLAAHSTFDAILRITGQSPVALSHPPVGSLPNTTTAIGATNPSVTNLTLGQTPAGVPSFTAPGGPVSFTLTLPPANQTVAVSALSQTVASLQAAERAAQQPQSGGATGSSTNSNNGGGASIGSPAQGPALPAPAIAAPTDQSAGVLAAAPAVAVAKISQTVTSLAIATVYPSPIFSLNA